MRQEFKYLFALFLALVVFAIVIGRVPGVPGLIDLSSEGEVTVSEPVSIVTADSLAARKRPTPGREEASRPLSPAPVITTPSMDYIYQNQNPDGTPVTFSPCRPIHFVIRPDMSPPNGEKIILDAIREVSNRTGLHFIYDGTTDEAPSLEREGYQPERYGDRWVPVLFAWTTPEETPGMSGEEVGEATTYQLVRENGFSTYVTGQVIVDVSGLENLKRDYGKNIIEAIVLHEVGHLVGLGHTSSKDNLMFHETRVGLTEFGPGDITGLARLGSGACAPDL